MEQLNANSYESDGNEDRDFEIKKVIKNEKLKNDSINNPSDNSFIKRFTEAIDNKDINKLKQLSNIIQDYSKTDQIDIIFELYHNNLLSGERLHYIMEYCTNFLKVSSNLIRQLMKEEKVPLLDIIFSTLTFYDNNYILKLLFYYKNKTAISTSDLHEAISSKQFKISTATYGSTRGISKYLINEIEKKEVNIYIIKYLIQNGADINKEIEVKYLVEHGANINKKNTFGETPLFCMCESGNTDVIKYFVDHGADINYADKHGSTPLFNACRSGNEDLVKYLVEHGAEINFENGLGDYPLSCARCSGNEALVKYLFEHGTIE